MTKCRCLLAPNLNFLTLWFSWFFLFSWSPISCRKFPGHQFPVSCFPARKCATLVYRNKIPVHFQRKSYRNFIPVHLTSKLYRNSIPVHLHFFREIDIFQCFHKSFDKIGNFESTISHIMMFQLENAWFIEFGWNLQE